MYLLAVLVVGMIVTSLNFVNASATTIRISWILLVIGIVLAAIHVGTGRFGVRRVRQVPVAPTRLLPTCVPPSPERRRYEFYSPIGR
jgi:uncharacterized membrane protein